MISRINPFAKIYKTMDEKNIEENKIAEQQGREPRAICMHVLRPYEHRIPQNMHRGRFNTLVNTDEAAVYTEVDGHPPKLDYTFYPYNNRLTTLSHMSPTSAPLCFPILFPFGELGWDRDMLQRATRTTPTRKNLTLNDHAKYRLSVRQFVDAKGLWHNKHHLHLAGKLLKQYILDSYLCIESNRLFFVRSNWSNFSV